MLRAIIVDDELIGINTLKILIEKYTNNVEVITTATEPEIAIAAINEYKPDILFLDISMPKMNAFELLEQLIFKDFKLVFTTAHKEFALKAIKNKAQDYLLKPIDIDELKNCISTIIFDLEKSNNTQKNNYQNTIELTVKGAIFFIKTSEIVRIEGSGSYSVFYLNNNTKHMISKNLKEFSSLLNPSLFYRCHRSNIINLAMVDKMINSNGLFALMKDGSKPKIGKKNKNIFLEMLKKI